MRSKQKQAYFYYSLPHLYFFTLSLLMRLKPVKKIAGPAPTHYAIHKFYFIAHHRITFLQTTSLFLHAGIPLSNAIENAKSVTIANQSFQKKNALLIDAITHGQTWNKRSNN